MKPLEADLRKMMSPNTASNLRESKRNSMRDFVDLAGPLGVTHFFLLSATAGASYLRLARAPRGPTLALRIDAYSLIRDVLSSQARPRAPEEAWRTAPLVVLHNFGGEGEEKEGEGATRKTKGPTTTLDGAAVGGGDLQAALKLLAALFRGAFPAIDVRSTRLSSCKRVVLLSHQGGGRVVVTLGARGAVMYQRGAEIARATPPKVKAVDATGAGDCFVGAICVALLEGMEPEAALRFACAAGAIAATRPGAQPSLPTRAEVEKILA